MADISKDKSDKKDKRKKDQKTIDWLIAQSLTRLYPLYESNCRTGLRLVSEVVSLFVAEIKRKAKRELSHIL